MPLLELTEVFARYGPIRALHGVTLKVGEGEVVAVLGANGAGKTTTLRSISRMTRTSVEIISFDGRRIARKSTESVARLGIAHVPEGVGLPELTVWENLRMGAVGRGKVDSPGGRADRWVLPWIERRRDQAAPPSAAASSKCSHSPADLGLPRLLMLGEPYSSSPRLVRELACDRPAARQDDGLAVLVIEQARDRTGHRREATCSRWKGGGGGPRATKPPRTRTDQA